MRIAPPPNTEHALDLPSSNNPALAPLIADPIPITSPAHTFTLRHNCASKKTTLVQFGAVSPPDASGRFRLSCSLSALACAGGLIESLGNSFSIIHLKITSLSSLEFLGNRKFAGTWSSLYFAEFTPGGLSIQEA